MAYGGRGLISVFRGFSPSIDGAFCFGGVGFLVWGGGGGGAGGWAIILWGLDNFLIFPNFLIS